MRLGLQMDARVGVAVGGAVGFAIELAGGTKDGNGR